jgi:PAS domain S-box-containing protein
VWEDGSVVEVHGIGRDVTQWKAGEESLRQSLDEWRDMFDSCMDLFFVTTLDGTLIKMNPAGEVLSGYDRDELVGTNILRFYNDESTLQKMLETIFKEGYVKDYEIVLKRKNGTVAQCLVTASVRKDKEGTIIGFQGMVKDITEKKKLDQQLMQIQKMEAIGTLSAGMAHNFNNILMGIMGYTEYLLMKKSEDDPDYAPLRTIHENTFRATSLTKKLLGIGQRMKYEKTRLNINDIIFSILSLLNLTFDKSIEVETRLSDDLFIIEGDAGQLEQCVLNLCINARDAMNDSGRLIIATENRKLSNDFIEAHPTAQEGDYVMVSITDTGTGIASDIKQRIFEPFFTTKKDGGGTGMGLSLVYGIIQNHHGIITVDSIVGKGSTFSIFLPAKK